MQITSQLSGLIVAIQYTYINMFLYRKIIVSNYYTGGKRAKWRMCLCFYDERVALIAMGIDCIFIQIQQVLTIFEILLVFWENCFNFVSKAT